MAMSSFHFRSWFVRVLCCSCAAVLSRSRAHEHANDISRIVCATFDCDPSNLDCQRGSYQVSGFGTAGPGVGLVLTRVSGHLAEDATAAEDGTAQILATVAILLGDRVLPSHALAGLTEGVKRPDGKENAPNGLQHHDERRKGLRRVAHRGNLERVAVDSVGNEEQHHHLEGVPGGDALACLSEPGEGHTGHDLCHGDFGAPDGTTEGGVADPDRKAIEETVLPPPGGGVDAFDSIGWGKGD